MGTNSIITITAYKRPYYFEEVVHSLEKAGSIEDYDILVSVDGGYPDVQSEIINIAKNSKLHFDIITHSKNLGCAGNTGYVLKEGFNRADKVIHLEEDIIISRGYLLYMEQMLDIFKDSKNVFSITGFSHNKTPDLGLLNRVELVNRFRCVGWAMWKDRFEEIEDWFGITWKPDKPFNEGNVPEGEEFVKWVNKTDKGSWGWAMDMYHRNGRCSVAPYVSKSRHIGQCEGTFCKGNEKVKPTWAGNIVQREGKIEI